MRAIDADALMEAINTWPKFGVDERCRIVPWDEGYEPYIHLRDAVIAITGMPTIEERKWIPCSERLPEEDYCTGRGIQHSESVLVTIVHHANDDDVFVDMACTVDGKWQSTYPFDDDPDIPKWCEIIAWMPLPEPYAERREE